jgi:hypothetical protein
MRWDLKKHHRRDYAKNSNILSAGRFTKVETATVLDDCGLIEKLTNYKYHRS